MSEGIEAKFFSRRKGALSRDKERINFKNTSLERRYEAKEI
jgi:hypothetical protein